MRFRVAGQLPDGRWETILPFGFARLRECRRVALERWESGAYRFVGIFTSKNRRKAWFGSSLQEADQADPSH